ncbi:MAG TPA: chemotaxis protein CheW, partial [Steroidobacteraceae bacterium]|nr:chemotaxis protein CheW [Steroidobacteraceae bacterium]
VPFSAMMTRVLTVEAGGQMYGVPLESVIETVSVPTAALARVGAAEAIVLKGRTIPVLDLASLLGARPQPKEAAEATIVVVAFAGQNGGLRVDRLGESLEVMLRPCEGLLLGTPGITGTTLMGDGRVLLVLDIAEMLQ